MRRLTTSTLLFAALFFTQPAFAKTETETGRSSDGPARSGESVEEKPESSNIAAPAMPPRRPPSRDEICRMIESAASREALPVPFFARLIWQESRFNPRAVSPAGALGVAQFMPFVATGRGLEDPFDPLTSLYESAEYLRELLRKFGNVGLAAAAYNAGPKRVQDWLAKRGILRRETLDYVEVITGRSPAKWAGQAPASGEDASTFECNQIHRVAARPPIPAKGDADAEAPAEETPRAARTRSAARNGILGRRGAQPVVMAQREEGGAARAEKVRAGARTGKVAEQRRKATDARRSGKHGSPKVRVAARGGSAKLADVSASRKRSARTRLAASGRETNDPPASRRRSKI
jgi:hypothetical protein